MLHKNGFPMINKILRLSGQLLTQCLKENPSDYLLAAANIPPTDLFLKQQAILRLINIARNTPPNRTLSIFEHSGPTTKLLKEACSDFNIQWENLKILSPRFKCGPQLLHPSDRTLLMYHSNLSTSPESHLIVSWFSLMAPKMARSLAVALSSSKAAISNNQFFPEVSPSLTTPQSTTGNQKSCQSVFRL